MKKTYNTPTTTPVEPIQVVANIIQTEMDLKDNQIAFDYQKFDIPRDGPFVAVGYLGNSTQIANQTYFDNALNKEVNQSVFLHTIEIKIMSLAPDNSARIRKEEIALALRSFYSLQQQDENFMGIAWLQGDFVDASYAEATGMLQRYVTTCAVTALHQKIAKSDYFDNFPIKLITDDKGGDQKIVTIPTTEPFAQ